MKLPWLRATWQQLMHAAQNKRLAHGLGFLWQPDLASDKLIEQLSQWLLCQESATQPKACGRCKSCLLWQAQSHPDYYRIGSDDDASIGVDAVRMLQTKLQSAANQGGQKVALIAPADKLTVAAANALLKTLEEPPAQTTLIVASERQQALLPTVRSRLQFIPVVPPSIDQLAQWLTQYGQQPVNSNEALRVWCRAPLEALRRLQEGTLAANNPVAAMVAGTEPLPNDAKQPEVANKLLASFEQLLRDAMAYQLSHNESLLIDPAGLRQSGLMGGDDKINLAQLVHELRELRQRLRQQAGLNAYLGLQRMLTRIQAQLTNA